MIWIRVQFHLTASFLNDPLPIVFGVDAKASTIFQSLVHSRVFHTLPLQQLTQQSSSLSRRLFLILYALFSVLVNALPFSLWHRFGTQNTFVEIQSEHSFTAFVPNTFRSVSAESHHSLLTPTRAMLNYLRMRWVHWYNDQMEIHWWKGCRLDPRFWGKKNADWPQKRLWPHCIDNKRRSSPFALHKIFRRQRGFSAGKLLGVEGATLSVFPGLRQALSAYRDASLKNSYLILDVFA